MNFLGKFLLEAGSSGRTLNGEDAEAVRRILDDPSLPPEGRMQYKRTLEALFREEGIELYPEPTLEDFEMPTYVLEEGDVDSNSRSRLGSSNKVRREGDFGMGVSKLAAIMERILARRALVKLKDGVLDNPEKDDLVPPINLPENLGSSETAAIRFTRDDNDEISVKLINFFDEEHELISNGSLTITLDFTEQVVVTNPAKVVYNTDVYVLRGRFKKKKFYDEFNPNALAGIRRALTAAAENVPKFRRIDASFVESNFNNLSALNPSLCPDLDVLNAGMDVYEHPSYSVLVSDLVQVSRYLVLLSETDGCPLLIREIREVGILNLQTLFVVSIPALLIRDSDFDGSGLSNWMKRNGLDQKMHTTLLNRVLSNRFIHTILTFDFFKIDCAVSSTLKALLARSMLLVAMPDSTVSRYKSWTEPYEAIDELYMKGSLKYLAYRTVDDNSSPIKLKNFVYANANGKPISLTREEVIDMKVNKNFQGYRKLVDLRSLTSMRTVMKWKLGTDTCLAALLAAASEHSVLLSRVKYYNTTSLNTPSCSLITHLRKKGAPKGHLIGFKVKDASLLNDVSIIKEMDFELTPYMNSRDFLTLPPRMMVSSALSRIAAMGPSAEQYANSATKLALSNTASSGYNQVGLFNRIASQVSNVLKLRNAAKRFFDIKVTNDAEVVETDVESAIASMPCNWMHFLFNVDESKSEEILKEVDGWQALFDKYSTRSRGPLGTSPGFILGGLREDKVSEEINMAMAIVESIKEVRYFKAVRFRLDPKNPHLSVVIKVLAALQGSLLVDSGLVGTTRYTGEVSMEEVIKTIEIPRGEIVVSLILPAHLLIYMQSSSRFSFIINHYSNEKGAVYLDYNSNNPTLTDAFAKKVLSEFIKGTYTTEERVILAIQDIDHRTQSNKFLQWVQANAPLSICINKMEVYENAKCIPSQVESREIQMDIDKRRHDLESKVNAEMGITNMVLPLQLDTRGLSTRIVNGLNFFCHWWLAMCRELMKDCMAPTTVNLIPMHTGDILQVASNYSFNVRDALERIMDLSKKGTTVYAGHYSVPEAIIGFGPAVNERKMRSDVATLLYTYSDNLYVVYQNGVHDSFDLSKSESGASERDAKEVINYILSILSTNKRMKPVLNDFLNQMYYYLIHIGKTPMHKTSTIIGDIICSYRGLSSGTPMTYFVNDFRSKKLMYYHYFVADIFDGDFMRYRNSDEYRRHLWRNKNSNVVEGAVTDNVMEGIVTHTGVRLDVLSMYGAQLCVETDSLWKIEKSTDLLWFDIEDLVEPEILDTDLLGFSIRNIAGCHIPTLDDNRCLKALLLSKDESMSAKCVMYGTRLKHTYIAREIPVENANGKKMVSNLKKFKAIIDANAVGEYMDNEEEVKTSKKKGSSAYYVDNVTGISFMGVLIHYRIGGDEAGQIASAKLCTKIARAIAIVLDMVKYYGLTYYTFGKMYHNLFIQSMLSSLIYALYEQGQEVVDLIATKPEVFMTQVDSYGFEQRDKIILQDIFTMLPKGIRQFDLKLPTSEAILNTLRPPYEIVMKLVDGFRPQEVVRVVNMGGYHEGNVLADNSTISGLIPTVRWTAILKKSAMSMSKLGKIFNPLDHQSDCYEMLNSQFTGMMDAVEFNNKTLIIPHRIIQEYTELISRDIEFFRSTIINESAHFLRRRLEKDNSIDDVAKAGVALRQLTNMVSVLTSLYPGTEIDKNNPTASLEILYGVKIGDKWTDHENAVRVKPSKAHSELLQLTNYLYTSVRTKQVSSDHTAYFLLHCLHVLMPFIPNVRVYSTIYKESYITIAMPALLLRAIVVGKSLDLMMMHSEDDLVENLVAAALITPGFTNPTSLAKLLPRLEPDVVLTLFPKMVKKRPLDSEITKAPVQVNNTYLIPGTHEAIRRSGNSSKASVVKMINKIQEKERTRKRMRNK